VKEELLTRLAEMGAFVEQGTLFFNPVLLREREFTTKKTTFDTIDVNGQKQSISLPASSPAYTFCQVPIVYIVSDENQLEITYTDGHLQQIAGNRLDAETSQHLFSRDGRVKQITVHIQPVPELTSPGLYHFPRQPCLKG
jgi:hypothetical protein